MHFAITISTGKAPLGLPNFAFNQHCSSRLVMYNLAIFPPQKHCHDSCRPARNLQLFLQHHRPLNVKTQHLMCPIHRQAQFQLQCNSVSMIQSKRVSTPDGVMEALTCYKIGYSLKEPNGGPNNCSRVEALPGCYVITWYQRIKIGTR